MTLNAKTMTNLALAALMIGMAAWAVLVVTGPGQQRVVGVVEVGEVQ